MVINLIFWHKLAKNHENGCANPFAHMQKLDFEFCNSVSEKNPYVAEPLRRTDCSMVSDGAAALIIQDIDLHFQQKERLHLDQEGM